MIEYDQFDSGVIKLRGGIKKIKKKKSIGFRYEKGKKINKLLCIRP